MPMHDWTRVRANRFHHFHQCWTPLIAAALNEGLLPEGYVAMAERPARAGDHVQADAVRYARRADRVAVRHPDGDVVAVIEIVSPGNKDSANAVRSFTQKAADFLLAGVHLLIVNPFPPAARDPQGVHKLVWDRIRDEPFELPPDKPLTLAAYSAGGVISAFVENLAVGDPLPDMPVFLQEGWYVPCPLEATYRAAWGMYPRPFRAALESGA